MAAQIKQLHRNVIEVSFKNIQAGWQQWIMLTSDRHFDSVECDRDLMKKDLEKAKERKALILDVGDFFDCMNGRYDPRRNYAQMRPEYFSAPSYLQAIVDDAARFFSPYAAQMVMVGRGNHDQSIRKNNDYDLITALTTKLNDGLERKKIRHTISIGGYSGWVRFSFSMRKTIQKSLILHYHHGAGGGGPVTRGVIQSNRQAVYLPDADFVVNGHTHDGWYVPIRRARLSMAGVPIEDYQHHIRVPSYKEDYGDGAEGWHIERWGAPKPKGCAWIHFVYSAGKLIESEVTASYG